MRLFRRKICQTKFEVFVKGFLLPLEDNYRRLHMSTHRPDKNIALAPDLLKRIEDLAGTDRTVDEVANEAIQRYVDAQESVRDLRSFIARNRNDMEARGVKESDIAAEIAADRKERRR
jgi:predicted transcriptional regulator